MNFLLIFAPIYCQKTIYYWPLIFNIISDSSNSGGENMYTMMKPVPGGNMPGVKCNFDISC